MQKSPVLHIYVGEKFVDTLPMPLIAQRLNVPMNTYDEVVEGVKLLVEDLINVAVQHFIPKDQQKMLENIADTYYPEVPDTVENSYLVSANQDETEFTLVIPGDTIHRPVPVS